MATNLPYYPLYVFDFDEDPNVLAMSLSEAGLYLFALNDAWKRGSIPDDPKELAVLIRRNPSEVCKAWPKVRPCWKTNGTPGRLVNPRQEKERELIANRSAAAAENGRKGASKRWPLDGKGNSYPNSNTFGSGSGSASSGLETSNTETPSTRTRGESVDFETFMHRWKAHRNFKKPQAHLRAKAEERWKTIFIDEEDLAAAMDGYYASDWGKAQNYPILGFVKDPLSWISEEHTEPIPASAEVLPAVIASPVDALKIFIQECEPRFRHYLGVFFTNGKELLLPTVKAAHSKWLTLSDGQREGAIAHAERNFPNWRLIPAPLGHLDKEPWTALHMERAVPVPTPAAQLSKAEQTRILARAKGWNV